MTHRNKRPRDKTSSTYVNRNALRFCLRFALAYRYQFISKKPQTCVALLCNTETFKIGNVIRKRESAIIRKSNPLHNNVISWARIYLLGSKEQTCATFVKKIHDLSCKMEDAREISIAAKKSTRNSTRLWRSSRAQSIFCEAPMQDEERQRWWRKCRPEMRVTARGKRGEDRRSSTTKRDLFYKSNDQEVRPRTRSRHRERREWTQPPQGGHGTLHLDLRFSFLSHLRQEGRKRERRR